VEQAGRIFYRQPVKTLTPIEIIKAVHCLQYQSCEHEEWQTSEAAQNCHQIVHQAASLLPGYEAAPWGIAPDQADPEGEADTTELHNGDGDARIVIF
jgi:hypothetical protein